MHPVIKSITKNKKESLDNDKYGLLCFILDDWLSKMLYVIFLLVYNTLELGGQKGVMTYSTPEGLLIVPHYEKGL